MSARVLGFSLGLVSVLGLPPFVGAVHAQRMLIVRDGSVSVEHPNARFDSDGGRQRKWQEKAETVEVWTELLSDPACRRPTQHQTEFQQVTFKVRDRATKAVYEIEASNRRDWEWDFTPLPKKLKLTPKSGSIRFEPAPAPETDTHKLVNGPKSDFELSEICVYKENAPLNCTPAQNGNRLCARFSSAKPQGVPGR